MIENAPPPRDVACRNGSRIRIEYRASNTRTESFAVTLLEGQWVNDYALMDIVCHPGYRSGAYVSDVSDTVKIVTIIYPE